MNIKAEIEAISALRDEVRKLKENRTPFLDVAAGQLQAAAENLQYHLDALAKLKPAAPDAGLGVSPSGGPESTSEPVQ